MFVDNFYFFKVWVSVDVGGCCGQIGFFIFVDIDMGYIIYSFQYFFVGDCQCLCYVYFGLFCIVGFWGSLEKFFLNVYNNFQKCQKNIGFGYFLNMYF